MTQLTISYRNPSESLLIAIAAVSDPGLVGLLSLDEIAVFLSDSADAEFARFWLPDAEIISETVLLVQPDDLAILARGVLEFEFGRVIRLEVAGGDEVEAIGLVVARTCPRFALRLSDEISGCQHPTMCPAGAGAERPPGVV